MPEQVPELTTEQRIFQQTHGIVSGSNGMDVVAMAAARWATPRFDTWTGIVVGALAYSADFFDGRYARRHGVAGPVGAAVDAGGDKIKLAWGLKSAWEKDLAPKPLLAAVAIRNGANAAITGIDRALNQKPHIEVQTEGKVAIAAETLGIGLNIIGKKIESKNLTLSRRLKVAGVAIALAGNIFGYTATRSYAKKVKQGTRRQIIQSAKDFADEVLFLPEDLCTESV